MREVVLTTALGRGLGVWLLIATFALPGGCNTVSHRKQRLAAEKSWNQFRGDFHFRLATKHFEQARISQAMSDLASAISIDPDTASYHRLLAQCYIERREFSAASASLDRADALGDDSAEGAYLRGLIAECQSRYADALAYYDRAATTDPSNVDFAIAAAEGLVTLGRVVEAKAYLDERVNSVGDPARMRLLRARLCVRLGQWGEAAADFELVTDLARDTPSAVRDCTLTLIRVGHYAKAVAFLQPIVDAVPGGEPESSNWTVSSAVRALAMCYERLGEPRRAKQLLRDLLDRDPDDARAWWLLATISAEQSDWATARECLRQGEQISPHLSHWRLLRAYLAWRQEDNADAMAILRGLLQDQPEDTLARSFLGQINDDVAAESNSDVRGG